MFYDIDDLRDTEIYLKLKNTCEAQPENVASARTCELAGGKFLEIADIPEDNEMYEEGKRKVSIYRFDI